MADIQDNAVVKSAGNFLTAFNLRLSGANRFFGLVMGKYTADKTPRRMEVAIKALKRRFPQLDLADELTWALGEAAAKDNRPMMDFLLGQGAKIDGATRVIVQGYKDAQQVVPLFSAIKAGAVGAVSHLLAAGAKPDPMNDIDLPDGYLGPAAVEGRGLVKLFIEAGARKGADKALFELIANRRDIETAEYLAQKTGVGVNALEGKIVRTVIGDYGHRARPYFQGVFAPFLNDKALQYLSDAGADFATAAHRFRGQFDEDAPRLADIADSWARHQARAFRKPAAPAPVAQPVAAPVAAIVQPFKGTPHMMIAPEKASFKRKPKSGGTP